MKKSLSRLLCTLLVVAMVCSLIPAALATGETILFTDSSSLTLNIGETATRTATCSGTHTGTDPVRYSSGNEAVATVDSTTGEVTAVGGGTTTITAECSEHTDATPATISVTVNYAAITAFTITPSKTIAIGEDFTPTVTITPNTANQAVTWTLINNDGAVKAFDSTTGKVTGQAVGTATIIATSVQDSNKSASCVVTVNKGVITAITNPDDIIANYNTVQSTLGLPTTVKGTVGTATVDCTVGNWTGTYTPTASGKYTLTAPVTLPADYSSTLSEPINATINVYVKPDKPTLTTDAVGTSYALNAAKVTSWTATASTIDTNAQNYTYAWYYNKTDSTDVTTATLVSSTAVCTPKVDVAGTFYYFCVATCQNTSNSGKTLVSAATTKGTYKVIVNSPYKVVVTTSSSTTTVGIDPTLTVKVYDTSSGSDALVNDGTSATVTWSLFSNSALNAKLDSRIATTTKTTTYRYGSSKNDLVTLSTGDTTSEKSIYVQAIVTIGGVDYASEGKPVKLSPADAKTFNFASTSDGVTFDDAKFYSAVYTATGSGEKLSYVRFTDQTGGTLYRTSKTNSSNKVASSDQYYYNYKNTGYDLDTVYFELGSGSKHYVSYVAYSDNGIVATGTVTIGATSGDITYTVAAGGQVTFSENDFNTFVKTASGRTTSGYTLDYVKFYIQNADFAGSSYSSSAKSKYGDLYETATLRTEVDSTTKYCYQATSRESDLDTVTYGTGSSSGTYTVIIPFTAYNENGDSYDGNVKVEVTAGHNIDILGAQFKGQKITAEVEASYAKADYVKFTLPASAAGKLFYKYSTIASGSYDHLVAGSEKYYLSPSKTTLYDLQYVYFVPAADCATSLSVTYTAYDSSDNKLGTGTIVFTVSKRTSSSSFYDVTSSNTGSWSANAVDFMYANGLIAGVGSSKFAPNDSMTRAMLVTVMYRAAGSPSVSSVTNPFKDVKSGTYYYNAVLWAYSKGVVTGNTATTFNPNGSIKRQEIAAILYRYAGSPSGSNSLSGYDDYSKISSYALSAVKWAVSAGYIQGSGSRLNPTASATRAEVAVMLYRFLTK